MSVVDHMNLPVGEHIITQCEQITAEAVNNNPRMIVTAWQKRY